METLKNLTVQSIGEQLTFLPVGSRVNHSLQQENERERKILDTSGRKCLESLENLENKGYQVAPYLLPACGVQAPHNRARIFIVAHINRVRCNQRQPKWNSIQRGGLVLRETNSSDTKVKSIANTHSAGLSIRFQRWQRGIQIKTESFQRREHSRGNPANTWEKFPTQSPICGGNDGVSNRVDRVKALGNSIVPQVAFEIFKAIEQTHILNHL